MFPIRHSVVDNEALGEEIRQRWNLQAPLRCELITRGMNDVYLIKSGNDRFAARVWRADKHTADNVTWELEYLAHLKKKGIPVIAAVPNTKGGLSFGINAPEGSRRVCLFEWAEGDQFYAEPSEPLARRIGGAIAQVHLAGADFKGRTARPIDFPGEIRRKFPTLVARLDERPDDLAFYQRVAEVLPGKIEEAYAAGVPYGPLHGDVHAKNVFVTPDGNFTILDFDTCGEAHIIHDCVSLAWANSYFLSKGDKRMTPALTNAFMHGYEEIRPIEDFERSCLPLFMVSKEFSYMCGMSDGVNYVGHMSFGPTHFDWFAQSVRRHVEQAHLFD
ncbi:MAG: phosphotransferase [Alphaproteobacteria bacterium]|nr:phosphotransferase [Alphaproteobacteria bacterium]